MKYISQALNGQNGYTNVMDEEGKRAGAKRMLAKYSVLKT